MLAAVTSEHFRKGIPDVFRGDERWQKLDVPTGDRFAWEADSTYVQPAVPRKRDDGAGSAGRHR